MEKLAEKWNFTALSPVANLSFNFLAHVEMAGQEPRILKMGPPAADYRKEITWLRSYPQVAPRVFNYDEEFNAFFMERFSPAETLWKWSLADRDDDATRVLAEMIRRLYLTPATAPQEIPVPHLAELASAFAVLRGRIDAALLTKAEGLWKELTVPSGHDVFLHGDLNGGIAVGGATVAGVGVCKNDVVHCLEQRK